MKKSFIISFGFMVALFMMSVCLTSCSDDFSNTVGAPQKKSEDPKTNPDKSQPDPTDWKQAIRKYYRVEPSADVTSVIIGQRNNGDLDSLVLKYKYIYSLAADTTILLDTAPTGDLGYSTAADRTDYSEYSHNAQGDSVCYINYAKPYYLSNGVALSLKTQRVRGYHMMGGQPVMYSEPNQSVARLEIGSSVDEFERNDSIFGRRTNLCSVELTLGGQKFVPSCKVTEIWFIKVKEQAVEEAPEPHSDVFVNEPVSYLASSMVQLVPSNNWKNVHFLDGASKVHPIVVTTDAHNAKVVAVEDKPYDRSRVIVSDQVKGGLYDATTGLFITAALTPDNDGWEGDGVIDGRHVEYSRSYAQMIDEGVKNFMETNTSKPTLTFSGVSATVTATWKEYEYTTITWTKYSRDGKSHMNSIVVKSPKK